MFAPHHSRFLHNQLQDRDFHSLWTKQPETQAWGGDGEAAPCQATLLCAAQTMKPSTSCSNEFHKWHSRASQLPLALQVPALSPLQPPAFKAHLFQEPSSIKRPRAFFHSVASVLGWAWKRIYIKLLPNSAYDKHDWNSLWRKIPHSLPSSCLPTAAAH